MTHIPSAVRLARGHQIEAQFLDRMNSRALWTAHMFGQRNCSDRLQSDLRKVDIPISSEYAQNMISKLPEDWQHIYKRGIGKSFPTLCRWDADAFCIYNGQPKFFAEIKSTNPEYPKVTFEISCYLGALINSLRLGLPLYFIFYIGDPDLMWSYLTLDEFPNCVSRVLDGKNASGSGTPFALIDKKFLNRSLEDLLSLHEQEWLL